MPTKSKSLQRVRFPVSVFRDSLQKTRPIFERLWKEAMDVRFTTEAPHELSATIPVVEMGWMNTSGPDEEWRFDNAEEFFEEVSRDTYYMADYRLTMTLQPPIVQLHVQAWSTYVVVEATAPNRADVLELLSYFEGLADAHRLPDDAVIIEPQARPSIFIGHGGASREFLELQNELQNVHGYPVQSFETGARAGHHIRDILDGFLEENAFALIVFTKADEQADGTMRARQNVVHEAGLFQGRLGFGRAIGLLEEGVDLFSNVDGIQYIPFSPGQLKKTVGEVLAVLKREFPDSP